ncbi:MAG: type restriction enzyme, partial [Acidobacteriota bacterium]|nr:type restriction enzyme [Acidobacteriota bacterium]
MLPLLMACRETIQLMEVRGETHVTSYDFPTNLQKLSDAEIDRYVHFLCTSRVLELLEHIKSVPDYVTGVEVGMDTNGRKNRGGECGVKAVQPFVNEALTKLS